MVVADPTDDRTPGAPPLDPAARAIVIADEARDRRDEADTEEALTRDDRRHRTVMPLVVGVLILGALAAIWRWIS
jgi:hypothetical protein